MNLTELEQHVFAYFLCREALQVNVDGRFYKRDEFIRIFEDQIFFATPDFGGVVNGRPANIARNLVEKLIEEEALSSVHDELSGISHQFNSGKYKAFIRKQIGSNSICQRAAQGGPKFWEESFAALSKG